jgi:hypothetical protein
MAAVVSPDGASPDVATPPWVLAQAEQRATTGRANELPPSLVRPPRSVILTGRSGSDSDGLNSRGSLSETLSQAVGSIVGFARRHLSWSPSAPVPNVLPPHSPVVFVPNLTQQGTTPAQAKSLAKETLRKAAATKLAAAGSFDCVDDEEGEQCSICLMPVQHGVDGEDVAVMGCGHLFHAECYKGWAEKDKRTCPNCRCPLAIEDRACPPHRS